MASSSSSSWDLNSTCGLLSSLNLDRHKFKEMQNMEGMDIDQVVDVPDTPDRIAARSSDGVECVDVDSNASVVGHVENLYSRGEGNRVRMMTGRDHNRRLRLRLPPKERGNDRIEHPSNAIIDPSDNSSTSRNAPTFRKLITDKHDSTKSTSVQHVDKGKDFCPISPLRISNLRQLDGDQDLKEQREHLQLLEKAFPHGETTDSLASERRKGAIINECSWKGKGKMDEDISAILSKHHGRGISIVSDVQSGTEKSKFVSPNSIASTRAAGRKRLVRNGCISPHNIAKAKLLAEQNSGSKDPNDNHTGTGHLASNSSPFLIEISDSSAESKHFLRNKGKGVIVHPGSSKEVDDRTQQFSSRTLNVHNEKDNVRRNFSREELGLFEGPGGWRSTHNRSTEIALPLSNEGSSSRINTSVGHNHDGEDKMDGRENLSNNWTECDYNEIWDIVSSRHELARVVPQRVPNSVAESVGRRHYVSNTLIKRQKKQGSTSRNYHESSAMGLDDSEVILLDSSGQPSNSALTIIQSSDHSGTTNLVTGVHDSSSASRESRRVGSRNNDDSDARARQLEADEILARELQEQLYQEVPIDGDSEMDANIAWTLQQEAHALRASSRGNHLALNTRGLLVPPVSRQSRSRSLQQPSSRRGARARVPATTRMAQLRSRIRSSASSSLPRDRSVFPLDMALDTRIDILEALEAVFGDVSDIGTASHILQVQRDFNENDYEMLLALDENNQQNGASVHQINSLPESVIQTDNFEETCAICLETPAFGDTIRHLPCLHKFHKDCIDPWLSRKTSCPVCKSSIR